MKIPERRLVLFISILLVAGFLATSLASYFVSKSVVRDTIISRELPITSDNIYSEIQRDLLRPVFISSMMAHDTFLRDWTLRGEKDPGEARRYLNEVMERYGAFTAFFVSEKTKTYYHPKGVLKKIRLEDPRDQWYFRVRAMKQDYEINVDPDEANRNAMTIFINYRVFDYNGNFIGSTGVGLAVNSVQSLIDNYQGRYNRNIFFVDKAGTVVLKGAGMSNAIRGIKDEPGFKSIAPNILSSSKGSFQYRRHGDVVLLNTRFIPELQWYLLVEEAEDPSLAGLRKTLYGNLAICLVITLVVLAATNVTIKIYQAKVEERTSELRAAKDTAENATLLKDKFLSLVSHDLKGPIGSIRGMSQIASQEANSMGQMRDSAKLTLEITNGLLGLIDQLLDISRMQTGEIKLDKFDFSAFSLSQEIIAKISQLAHNKEIRLVNEVSPDSHLLADRTLAGQVLLNLLTNAIKFTPHGGTIKIYMAAERTLAVKDTGIGVKPEMLPNLFRHDIRTVGYGTDGEVGTGLGLPFCQDIMRAHGGTLRVETGETGSIFFAEFP